jgi:sulfatase modifying factor 1
MQTTEVTQGQWWQVMGTDPSSFDDCGDNCPVETVSWDEAQAFIEELNRREATNGYRLPTEAQWEYACRAGTTTPFSFGECLSTSQANYDGDYPYTGCSSGTYRKTPIAVASLGKNAWGLYDMHGNVWEWCSDWYGSYSSAVPRPDPEGPTSGNYRVIRGGSWNIGARSCRSANRNGVTPELPPSYLGFGFVMRPGQ